MTVTTHATTQQAPQLDFLKNWLYRGADVGDAIVYWRGYLCCDRMRIDNIDGRIIYRAIYPAEAIANLMWKAYTNKLVTLVQKRHGAFDYSYVAIRKEN